MSLSSGLRDRGVGRRLTIFRRHQIPERLDEADSGVGDSDGFFAAIGGARVFAGLFQPKFDALLISSQAPDGQLTPPSNQLSTANAIALLLW